MFSDKGKALVHWLPKPFASLAVILLLFLWPRQERNGFEGGLAPVHSTFTALSWLVLLSVSEY